MTIRSKSAVWLVIAFVGGASVGIAVSHSLRTNNPAQQTNSDRLQPPDAVVEEITQILNRCEPDRAFVDERDLRDWLSDYLRERTDYRIETNPSTEFGNPDILIERALAIELKKELTEKSTRDRCVGQCVGYAQRWYTMLVLLDTHESDVSELDTLLDLAGLEEIPIFELLSGDHE